MVRKNDEEPKTPVGRAGHDMQSSLWDGAFIRAGGRDIKCNLHSVMGHGGGGCDMYHNRRRLRSDGRGIK